MKQNEERQHEIENLRSFLENAPEYIIKNYYDYESSLENITEYIIENYDDYKNFLKNKRLAEEESEKEKKAYYKEAYKKVTNYLHSLGFSNSILIFNYLRDLILLYNSYESFKKLNRDIVKKYELYNHKIVKKLNEVLSKVDYHTKKNILGTRYSDFFYVDEFIEASSEILNLKKIDISQTMQDIHYIMLNNPHEVMEKISEYLTKLSIPKEYKGYTYLKEAIFIYLKIDNIHTKITKEIYPRIAKKYKTTIYSVDKAIRYTIDLLCYKADIDVLYGLFGNVITHNKGKTTNNAFICLIADYVKFEFY